MKKKLEDLRREAYVDAIYAKMEEDNVVGVFSDKVDTLLISYGFIPYPIVGVDSYVFEYFKLNKVCDPINSTLAYLKTKKCPLIYSSKFFVVDNYCNHFNNYLKENTDKDIVDEKHLKTYLDNLSDREFNEEIYEKSKEKFKRIDLLLKDLEKSDISGSMLYKLEFYIKFIKDLDDRILVLEGIKSKYKKTDSKRRIIEVTCPFAIADVIDKNVDGYYKIVKSQSPDFTYKDCIYEAENFITYKEI